MFRPRSVAVVGASTNPSFVSGILKNLPRYGYAGSVYAVNPRYDRVLDSPCYPTLLDIPEDVDLVVIGVAHRLVPAVLEHCERKGVGALEIVTSGFSEMGGDEATQRQDELAAWARRTGIPVGGPNCLGLLNATIGMNAFPSVFEKLVPGHVATVLQSGMMAPSVIAPLLARDIGLTIGVTSGNEADLEAADYIRYCAEDDETRVIACFTEQIKTPAKFVAACELAAERQKPIVMLKIGRSEGGRASALAHTGSMVGSDDVIDSVLRKLGVTRVSTVEELHETTAIFHAKKLPRGRRVAVVSVSGGAGGLLADLAQEHGVELPPLPEATAAALREVVPEYGSVSNPLDITGQGVFATDIADGAINGLARSDAFDIIVWARGFPSYMDRETPVGQILERAVREYPEVQFLVMSLVGGHLHASQSRDVPIKDPILHLDDVPFLQGSELALKAIAALVRYAEFQRARLVRGAAVPGRQAGTEARPTGTAGDGRPLTEREGKEVLALYGIPVTREQLAATLEEAEVAAREIGYPLALKVESPDLLHKTDAGALALGVTSETLPEAFERVLANARRAKPDAEIRGVLVQEMVPPGTELILGMQRDEQFGPVVAVGLGGIFVETLKDVELLMPPVSREEALAAFKRLRGYPILLGERGVPPVDLECLADVVVRFSRLCVDLGELVREIDVNPVIAGPDGLRAVDCLMVPATE